MESKTEGIDTMIGIDKIFTALLIAPILAISVFAQQLGSIGGQVQDTLGAVVVGATITVIGKDGKSKTTTSNQRGEFIVSGLAPGIYSVKVKADKFALYDNAEVEVMAGRKTELIVTLSVEAIEDKVEVSDNGTVSTDPANNASATVLKDKDLEALPDDPDELASALQALAGAAAGPNGGQIYIDGFTGGQIPPKEAIREIRINQNPFSAEYDRLGFGRIEILTKPGSDKFRGNIFGNFNDESLNSRNPFALNRAASQTRFFGGNVSGPLEKGKASYFFDLNKRDIDNNAVLNAILLDQNLNPVALQQDFTVPSRRFSFSPRLDYAIDDKNTLVLRYSYSRASQANLGIGGTSLPDRAYSSKLFEHEFRLTETVIINSKTVNETRFEFDWEKNSQTGDNSIPSISVADAFTGGGSQIGLSFNKQRSWELQNYTTTSFGKAAQHAVKFGVRIRSVAIDDRSENNFNGTFSFINLANYRDTLLGTSFPTQFRVTVGNPLQSVSRTDVGVFVTDDWRLTPSFTLSLGLRYENQTNISDNLNLAPRISFGWSPGAGGPKAPKTVFRGGFGWFYDRFSENLTLQALRFNGQEQLNLIVNSLDPDPMRRAAAIALLRQPVFTLSGVSNVPTPQQILSVLPQANTIRLIAPNLQVPYTIQTALGVERQLPMRTTLSVFYIGARTIHSLRSRNINAPICPAQVNCLNAPRPDPTRGDAYMFESSGRQNQNQLALNFRSTYSSRLSFFGFYRLGFAKGDTDGPGSFPAYSYDLQDEYGRSSFDIRHSFAIGGNLTLPFRISLNPFVIWNSGRPFNITRGVDLNGDGLFTERPTFAELAARCNQLNLRRSFCDISSFNPSDVVPRNFGEGPRFFNVNLRIGKTFGFGKNAAQTVSASPPRGPGGGNVVIEGGPGGGPRVGRGFGGFFGGSDTRKPYNLNLSVNFSNLLNTVNLANPVGNLASSRFGQSIATAGSFGGFGPGGGGISSANRRIELQARFSW